MPAWEKYFQEFFAFWEKHTCDIDLDDAVNLYLDSCTQTFYYWLKTTIRSCESPIEQLLLMALHMESLTDARLVIKAPLPQFEVSAAGHDYRIDIAVFSTEDAPRPVKVAVERDGHDFHERTKEQARRDKARDRHLQSEGWTIMRFTGSEIYQNPAKCAREVGMLVYRLSGFEDLDNEKLKDDLGKD